MSKERQVIVEQLGKIMLRGRTCSGILFKKVEKKLLKTQTNWVNEAVKYLKSKSITETNNFIRAASVWETRQIGLKKAEHRKKNEPSGKRSIKGNKKTLRSQEEEVKGELRLKKICKLSELDDRYRVKGNGLKAAIEGLKQRMLAKSAKLYQQRIKQFRQNRIFYFHQKKTYAELNGDEVRPSDVSNAEEIGIIWDDIWSVGKGHFQEAEWLKGIENQLRNDEHLQERVVISFEKVTKQCRKMPNWKSPERDEKDLDGTR